MGRYSFRTYPTVAQEQTLLTFGQAARDVWNALVQVDKQCRQRTAAIHNSGRPDEVKETQLAAIEWPKKFEVLKDITALRGTYVEYAELPRMVQNQAALEFFRALEVYRKTVKVNPQARPPGFRSWRAYEGFCCSPGRGELRVVKLNAKWSQVRVPKLGLLRFRQHGPLPECGTFRVLRNTVGQWHVVFQVVDHDLVVGPGDGSLVGVDVGVVKAVTLSTGVVFHHDRDDLLAARRSAAKAVSRRKRGSAGRERAKLRVAKVSLHQAMARKNFVEQTTTSLARGFDVVAVEDLNIRVMTKSARGSLANPGRNVAAKAGLNRAILDKGWGQLVSRLESKAGEGRVVRVPAAYTSQRCSACGEVVGGSRESQAVFRCRGCGFVENADVNAAMNVRLAALDRRPVSN